MTISLGILSFSRYTPEFVRIDLRPPSRCSFMSTNALARNSVVIKPWLKVAAFSMRATSSPGMGSLVLVMGAKRLRTSSREPVLQQLGRELYVIAYNICSGQGRIGYVRAETMQRVAEPHGTGCWYHPRRSIPAHRVCPDEVGVIRYDGQIPIDALWLR